ncbi:hypothetical protein L915_01641, partial [Phytophthora nicotianae]
AYGVPRSSGSSCPSSSSSELYPCVCPCRHCPNVHYYSANYYWVVWCPTSATGCTSETWETWKQAREDGAVTINYGLFVENAMTFLINAIFLFFAVKKVFEVVFKRNVLVKKQCPYCKEFVKGDATRCKYCHSDIECPPSSRGFWMTPV